MAVDLHVVTIDEFKDRSQELVREVHRTGKPLFVMDGDQMVVRILPPDASLEEIQHGFAVMDELGQISDDMSSGWTMTADDMLDRRG